VSIEQARFIRSAVKRSDLLSDGRPEIAFVGRSNVGKSSLLNRLLGRKQLARISSSPGKTRAINYFLIESRYYFVDLPGYGFAKVGKRERRDWAQLMESYFQQALPRVRVIQLVDGKVGATDLDVQANEYLHGLGCSPTVVATKIDRLRRGDRARRLAEIRQRLSLDHGRAPIPVSARTGDGIKDLWREINAFLRSSEGTTN
jgi:GTP-binding protein